MSSLSSEKKQQALTFIQTHGRPLDVALAEHAFLHNAKASALAALAEFQNPDGGYGQALEPDFLLPDSSPMATSVGLQVLRDLEVASTEPQIAQALEYLTTRLNSTSMSWSATSAAVNNFPHAPWWTHNPESTDSTFSLNPTAELLGYFSLWPCASITASTLDGWLTHTSEKIIQAPQLEAHELLCCVRLLEMTGDFHSRELVEQKVLDAAPQHVALTEDAWTQYCIKPLTAAPTPNSFLAAALHDSVQTQIAFEISNQSALGHWEPNWSWFGAYPDTWELVQPKISAMVTLSTLRALNAWGAG